MSITRTTINGSWEALKTALETLVPAFFASVELSEDTLSLTCKDENGNTLFVVNRSGNNAVWTPVVYRSADNSLSGDGGANYGSQVKYFFRCGANGAFMTLNDSEAIVIAKAKNGKTAVVIPAHRYGTAATKRASILAGCWGDDTLFSALLQITDPAATTPMEGNHNLFVPIPLYGTYGESNNIPKAFFMPMSQPQMRGVVQELHGEKGIYVTNGYVALLDDEQEG